MSLTEVLNEFEPTFRLQWYPADDNTAPNHGWTAPDWTIILGPHVYLVHSCKLGEKSNFFSSLMNQAESQASENKTDLTYLLPASCHDTWELVLNFMYQDRVLYGAPQQYGHRNVTGPNIVTVENAVALFKIAHVLRIPTLAHHCVHWMSNNQNVDALFVMLSAALKLAPGLDSIEHMCTLMIARKFSQVEVDRFLSLDMSSLTQIFVSTSEQQQQQQKVCEVTVHYLRHVDDEDQEQVFLQLSQFVRQLRTKDALFLYSLSLTHGSERLCALCLPVLSQQYERLDHTDLPLIRDDTIRCALKFNHDEAHDAMFAMDVRSAVDVLDVAQRDFQADPKKVNRFVVEYLKRSKEAEVTFKTLSKYVDQVDAGDALFLYGVSTACHSDRLCSIALKIVTSNFEQFFKKSACVLSEISHFDAVCHLLDQDELSVTSEETVFDAIFSYCRSSQNDLTAEQHGEVWSTCRFALLSDEYCVRAKNVNEIPKRWLDFGLEERNSDGEKSATLGKRKRSVEGNNWAEPSLMLKRLGSRRQVSVCHCCL